MIDLRKIKRPTLLLDETKCRLNISVMSAKARSSEVIFRPHFKTHQSLTIGNWFREEGTEAITVSSVTMAGHFASDGWKDITVAFPLNPRETEDINRLSAVSSINILTPNSEHFTSIRDMIRIRTDCFVKINTGNNRSGTDWDDIDEIERTVSLIKASANLHPAGFLTHAGHAYKSASKSGIIEVYNDTVRKLQSVNDHFHSEGTIITSGDTPSCSVVDSFRGLDEVRPGNFVFYDLMQLKLGSCSKEQIAVAVACPVVEKNRKKREIIIYGGGVHLSKDSLKLDDGMNLFGQVVILGPDRWIFPDEDVWLKSISQEHGVISAPGNIFDLLQPGDITGIIPVHSCMTADLLREYHTFDGKVISDFSPK